MHIIPISETQAVDLAIEEIHRHPILVQLPTGFAVLAAPTSRGAAQLDRLKMRQTGKNYGTVIGSLDNFIAQAQQAYLPDAFTTPSQYTTLCGTFIRLPFRDRTFQSKAIKDGIHQGLLLRGAYSALFSRVEASFAGYTPDKLWDYVNYGAPLGTSCHVSGDPDGSIVTFDKARQFAKARGINLLLTTTEAADQIGSYPIPGLAKTSGNHPSPGTRYRLIQRPRIGSPQNVVGNAVYQVNTTAYGAIPVVCRVAHIAIGFWARFTRFFRYSATQQADGQERGGNQKKYTAGGAATDDAVFRPQFRLDRMGVYYAAHSIGICLVLSSLGPVHRAGSPDNEGFSG